MSRFCQINIDSSALSANLEKLKRIAANSKVMAVVKSDAYGHGLLETAKALKEAEGFAVTGLSEAQLLRQAQINQPITLLSGFFEADELAQIAQLALVPVVHTREQLPALLAWRGTPIHIWLKINVGMNRLGFCPEDASALVKVLSDNPSIKLAGIMGHLSHAFSQKNHRTKEQIEHFIEATSDLPFPKTLANSAGTLGWPSAHFDWVRCGMSLYGVSPFDSDQTGADFGLQPVMQWQAKIMGLITLKKDTTVGYGGLWKAPQDQTLIATVSCGYGDGYSRMASTGTPVWIDGQLAPLVGRVSMDMITVDVTHLRGKPSVGQTVELWGTHLPVEKVAKHCQTIPYELCCMAGRTRVRNAHFIPTQQKQAQ